jgi:NTE family protein
MSYLRRYLIFTFVFVLLSFTCSGQTSVRPKIGLVLSGGAAKGLAHIGVLKVLKKAGIHVDYVAGTSMGSIIGAFYAMGYDPDTIETIFLNSDWVSLLTDEISRSSYSVEEKEEKQRYIVSFPIREYLPKLPSGLKAGHNISNLLARYTLPYMNIRDFSNLPKPFACIAVDIETGKEVVLNSGHLEECIRASMAIPTVFTPVLIDGKLLVDGGLVNNFPADQLKAMGADIIIGVNLGFKPFTKDELFSLTSIIEQSLLLPSSENNRKNEALCSILIKPDVMYHSRSDFKHTAGIIEVGVEAAMKHFSELKKLADSVSSLLPVPSETKVKRIDSLYIDTLQFEGLVNVSKDFLRGRLRIMPPCRVSVEYILNAIDRVYGSQFFEKITWRYDEYKSHSALVIIAQEKNEDLLRIGGRYDSDFNANLLLNIILRNKLIKGSKLSLDVILGQYRRIKFTYLVHTAWNNRQSDYLSGISPLRLSMFPDIGLNLEYNNFELFDYSEGKRIASYAYNQGKFGLFGLSNITNSFSLGASVNIELSNISPKIFGSIETPPVVLNSLARFSGFLNVDSYDESYYPTRGTKINAGIEWIKDLQDDKSKSANSLRFYSKFNFAIPIFSQLTLMPFVYTGLVKGDSIARQNYLYCGGLNNSNINPGAFPFIGLQFMELAARSVFLTGLNLQYQIAKNHYLTLRSNIGNIANVYTDVFTFGSRISGLGLSYGYNSLAGPLEFTLSRSFESSNLMTYINIGYWF